MPVVALDLSVLPDEARALIAAQAATIAAQRDALAERDAELAAQRLLLEKVRLQLARLRRMQFGRRSERLAAQADQLELALEDLEAEAGTAAASPAWKVADERAISDRCRPARRPLPDHLPREVVEHAAPDVCPACGGSLRFLGEDATEVLDWVPGRFRVVRHVRPKCSCRHCETVVQAPPPSLPIRRGRATAGLLAHVLVSKYADHLPLYRQAEILARAGLKLSRSTLADWVGQCAVLLRPLVDALAAHVTTAGVLHADDTPVPVLAPGSGKTKTGRLWAYVRDERPHGGAAPPAVFYRYTPDRRGEHPREHLAGFRGVLQADGYAGFAKLYAGDVAEAACWAHVRRRFFDLHAAGNAPLATETVQRIAILYEIERDIAGRPADQRARIRAARAGPALDALHGWLIATLARVPGRSDLAAAIRYALVRWTELTRYRDDGRLAIDNNAAERAIRPLVLGRKNWLFAGSDAGGTRAAAVASLIETARMNGIDPETYLRHVLGIIADYPVKRVAELLPWAIPDLDARLHQRSSH